MGIQASSAILTNKRVSVARRSHSFRRVRWSCRRSKSFKISPLLHSRRHTPPPPSPLLPHVTSLTCVGAIQYSFFLLSRSTPYLPSILVSTRTCWLSLLWKDERPRKRSLLEVISLQQSKLTSQPADGPFRYKHLCIFCYDSLTAPNTGDFIWYV
jgi:hypothetical protein